ncbi:lipocalin family protein [Muricauda sp. MAR_2010_75]|jgi:hypothetical protein|uniref:lipocalin family protein n=1 Tax=Allomuricauda sp. MAR_2010_75 TaxID=1250232 RepID=UPI000563EC88|nr:lipocalin family protein [Muricauda sp. MAR_2010_75]
MKKLVFIVFVIVLLFSCQTKSKIEGNWVLAYYQTISNKDTFRLNECQFISIDKDTLRYLNCQRSNVGDTPFLSSGKYQRQGNQIYFNNDIDNSFKIITINSDSLVLENNNNDNSYTFIYKKLPSHYKGSNWNPSNKNYQFIGNNGKAHLEFINDSLMLEYNLKTELYVSKKWWLEEFENYNFLILNQIDALQPILIDSIDNEFVYISTYDTNVNNYLLKKFPKKDITAKIRGNWKLLKSGLPPPPPESLIFQFEKFQVISDSIFAGDSRIPFKEKWIQTGDGRNILFQIKKSKYWRHWKIIKLKQDTLVLDMPDIFVLDSPGMPDRIRRIRTYVRD